MKYGLRGTSWISVATLGASIALAACGRDTGDAPGSSEAELGSLFVALESGDAVAGFRLEVVDAQGAQVLVRYLSGSTHAFFPLEPGSYQVTSTPMSSETRAAPDCTPVQKDAEILAGRTTELALFSRCQGEPGDLSVTVGANYVPDVLSVQVSPGTHVAACDVVDVAFEAADREADEISCELRIDAGETSSLSVAPSTEAGTVRCAARIQASAGASHVVTVSACDDGGCGSFAFALEVAAGSCETPCDDRDPTTIDEITQSGVCANDAVPASPRGTGVEDRAPVADEQSVPPYVQYAYTNQRGDARYASLETNAGVRVLDGFLKLWRPTTLRVDAGVSAPAIDGFPAVLPSSWTGIPGDASDGTALMPAVLTANIDYVVEVTQQRTAEQELSAYLDDRRHKGYSVTDGLGPLTEAWRRVARQVTTINDVPSDATRVRYDDRGNDNGVGGADNPRFGVVVDFVGNIGENGSTEPAKRFFKYARPWRWSSEVRVVPALEPAKSTTPSTDGGFISGHGAEAMRKALAMAYVVPERFQELLVRAHELGENRIVAGMHSPLDVMGGRMQAQAVVTASLVTGANAQRKQSAYAQAHEVLMAELGVADLSGFEQLAHAGGPSDRFADRAANAARAAHDLTYGFAPIGDVTAPANVPKGAEVLLETRLPYLSAEQRRVVLKTTALPSGYPLLDDAEGWGRLDLYRAADGYGAFQGDVVVTMDGSLGGFHARDHFRHDIEGPGKLTKRGSGTLALEGRNGYLGGTEVAGGTLEAGSATALGAGDVYVASGTLVSRAAAPLHVGGDFTQLDGTVLSVRLGRGGAGQVQVDGRATLAGGTLVVTLAPDIEHASGEILRVLEAGTLRGRFRRVVVDGLEVTPVYGATGLVLQVR